MTLVYTSNAAIFRSRNSTVCSMTTCILQYIVQYLTNLVNECDMFRVLFMITRTFSRDFEWMYQCFSFFFVMAEVDSGCSKWENIVLLSIISIAPIYYIFSSILITSSAIRTFLIIVCNKRLIANESNRIKNTHLFSGSYRPLHCSVLFYR